ncbi:G [Dog Tick rhabdovirus-1]|nr:G [Dog Tick rhabdovirus-1] [Dog Tick rhabdovirus-1]
MEEQPWKITLLILALAATAAAADLPGSTSESSGPSTTPFSDSKNLTVRVVASTEDKAREEEERKRIALNLTKLMDPQTESEKSATARAMINKLNAITIRAEGDEVVTVETLDCTGPVTRRLIPSRPDCSNLYPEKEEEVKAVEVIVMKEDPVKSQIHSWSCTGYKVTERCETGPFGGKAYWHMEATDPEALIKLRPSVEQVRGWKAGGTYTLGKNPKPECWWLMISDVSNLKTVCSPATLVLSKEEAVMLPSGKAVPYSSMYESDGGRMWFWKSGTVGRPGCGFVEHTRDVCMAHIRNKVLEKIVCRHSGLIFKATANVELKHSCPGIPRDAHVYLTESGSVVAFRLDGVRLPSETVGGSEIHPSLTLTSAQVQFAITELGDYTTAQLRSLSSEICRNSFSIWENSMGLVEMDATHAARSLFRDPLLIAEFDGVTFLVQSCHMSHANVNLSQVLCQEYFNSTDGTIVRRPDNLVLKKAPTRCTSSNVKTIYVNNTHAVSLDGKVSVFSSRPQFSASVVGEWGGVAITNGDLFTLDELQTDQVARSGVRSLSKIVDSIQEQLGAKGLIEESGLETLLRSAEKGLLAILSWMKWPLIWIAIIVTIAVLVKKAVCAGGKAVVGRRSRRPRRRDSSVEMSSW